VTDREECLTKSDDEYQSQVCDLEDMNESVLAVRLLSLEVCE